jgi:hypothetical protein
VSGKAIDTHRPRKSWRRDTTLLAELGLTLHPKKSDFAGNKARELLGIVVDTQRQLCLLSPEKLHKIASAARCFVSHEFGAKEDAPFATFNGAVD